MHQKKGGAYQTDHTLPWQGQKQLKGEERCVPRTIAISDTRNALLMEAGKGSSAMWRMTRRVKEIMAGLRETLCDSCREIYRQTDTEP